MENKTCLMLCFPAPWDPTPEESQSKEGTVSFLSVKIYCCLHILLGEETFFFPLPLFTQFLVCEIIYQKANLPEMLRI